MLPFCDEMSYHKGAAQDIVQNFKNKTIYIDK